MIFPGSLLSKLSTQSTSFLIKKKKKKVVRNAGAPERKPHAVTDSLK